jgi:polysaccharide biosynthesis/export protein
MKKNLGVTKWLVVALVAGGVCFAGDGPQANPASTASTPAGDSAKAEPTTNTPQFQERTPRYRLAPSDTFDINFDLSSELNQTVTVQPDGFITLRSVGDVHVAGLTVAELTDTLRKVYSPILHDPIISIVLKDFEKPYFIADGQIGKPGKYELRGETTVTQAIAIAGGFTEQSKHSQVLLFRRLSDQWTEAKILNVKKMEKEGNLREDPFLRPGDMLFVPKNTWSKIDHFIPSANLGGYVPLRTP